MTDHFAQPKETIKWAYETIAELQSNLTSFLNSKPYEKVIETNYCGQEAHKIRLTAPLPRVISRKATEAISHLRNSFDQSLFAACRAIKKPARRDIYFPWRNSPIDLEHVFKSKTCQIPPELWDVIRQQEPYGTGADYPGGNSLIREVATLANSKHTVGMSIIGNISGVTLPNIAGNINYLSVMAPQWDSVKNEVTLFVISGAAKVEDNYEIDLYVEFDSSAILSRRSAVSVLQLFARKAYDVLQALDKRCADLL